MEDFELCEKAQANLEKGIYHEGILNPLKENGVAFYQQEVLRRVVDQYEEEKGITGQADSLKRSHASNDAMIDSTSGAGVVPAMA